MNARSTAARQPEPTTLAEMHARKREADQRQAAAAQRFQRQTPADRALAEEFKRSVEVDEAETEAPIPADIPLPPEADAQIRQTLGEDRIERTPRRIISRIAEEFGVAYGDVVGQGRDAQVVAARFAAIKAVREAHPKRSLPWLGTQFGGRDHTTMLHALRQIGVIALPAANPVLAELKTDAQGMRAITPLDLPDLVPAPTPGPAPTFRLVDPRRLRVDSAYQRDLSNQSLALIRRIVSEWNWRAFKPPVVVEAEDGGLDVIDGQHTAVGAATHPGISEIPVIVVVAERREDRADAFVRHNRDRVRVSGMQMHVSLVAAGDPVASGIEEACRAAGARVLRSNSSTMRYAVGDTMAVEALGGLVRRRGVEGATGIVGICVAGELAPVTAAALRAVELLLFGPEHQGRFTPDALSLTLRALGPKLDRDAAIFAATHRLARWQGVAAVLGKHAKASRTPASGSEDRS